MTNLGRYNICPIFILDQGEDGQHSLTASRPWLKRNGLIYGRKAVGGCTRIRFKNLRKRIERLEYETVKKGF